MLAPTIKSEGTTPTEKLLVELSDKSFFGLWSYPNVFTDEGKTSGVGVGKELCDLLVVFDRHVFIFSDKDIKFNSSKNQGVAWKRWFKKSVVNSANQLFGAETWIKRFPYRIFLDKECQKPFPLDLSDSELKIHLIAVTSNIEEPIKSQFGGSSGTLFLLPSLNAQDCLETPFFTGDLYPNKTFVHVLDISALKLLMEQLNTIVDFANYLFQKEYFLRTENVAVVAGEEELLAFYLSNPAADDGLSILAHPAPKSDRALAIDTGVWEEYRESVEYQHKLKLNSDSHFWDMLINDFSNLILSGNVGLGQSQTFSTHETAIRLMAEESRFSRAILSQHYLDKLARVPSNHRSSAIVQSLSKKNKCFIFLFWPRHKNEGYEKYREERVSVAEAYSLSIKYHYPQIEQVVVIATEPKHAEGRSTDILCCEFDSVLTKMEREHVKGLMHEFGILTKDTMQQKSSLKSLQHIADKGKKIGRNAPCYCGSNKKYKKCCL